MKEQRENLMWYLARKTWRFSEGRRRTVAWYTTLFVIADSLDLLSPLIIAWILNRVTSHPFLDAKGFWQIFGTSSLLLLLSICFWCLHGPARVIERLNAFRARALYQTHLLSGVFGLPVDWHVEHHSGDTFDKLEKGSDGLYSFAGSGFEPIDAHIRFVGSYFALVYFNIHAAYIVAIMVLVTFFVIRKTDEALVAQYKELNRKGNKISEAIFDAVTNIITIIVLRAERPVLGGIEKKIREPLELYRKNCVLNEVKWFLVSISSKITIIALLGSYFFMNMRSHQTIAVGTVYALYGYGDKISDLFSRLADIYNRILIHGAHMKNAEELENDFRRGPEPAWENLPADWQSIQVEDLSFSYHVDQAELHLDLPSLTIRRGERIALVGESGGGKTTFLKIARGLHEPLGLKLLLDGELLPEGFAAISGSVALVPQDPELFAQTIEENILLGADYDRDDMETCIDLACFRETLLKLPRGLQSSIKERGVNLSGGEKQRLALVRALLAGQDKEIILLDETTSQVDAINEFQIFENIFSAFRGKTIIASIHRLHLLPLFDRVIMFQGGKVVATGTFSEISSNSSEFRALLRSYHHEYPSRAD